MKKIKWGIIGTGTIAKSFAKDFNFVDQGLLCGVVGRDYEKAQLFAKDHKISRCFTSIEELLKYNQIDAVYVATPHPSHYSICMQSLESGKHVLVEKPFMLNTNEAIKTTEFAKKQSLFLGEAMWTRFLPFVDKLKQEIKNGRIGDLQSIQSSMGSPFKNELPERLFSKELGGGSLLDMGVYSLAFSQMIQPEFPTEILSKMVLGQTGIEHKP